MLPCCETTRNVTFAVPRAAFSIAGRAAECFSLHSRSGSAQAHGGCPDASTYAAIKYRWRTQQWRQLAW